MIIVGLGNPGREYERTRHNAGRIILESIADKNNFSEWKEEKKIRALTSVGEISDCEAKFVLPNNFMNNSGASVAPLISSKKKLGELIVVYDDIDIPIGSFKISFDRSSGGHNGLESVIKQVKSKEFARIRIGISPKTAGGKIKRVFGQKEVHDFLMKNFSKKDLDILSEVSANVAKSIVMIRKESLNKAMSIFNS